MEPGGKFKNLNRLSARGAGAVGLSYACKIRIALAYRGVAGGISLSKSARIAADWPANHTNGTEPGMTQPGRRGTLTRSAFTAIGTPAQITAPPDLDDPELSNAQFAMSVRLTRLTARSCSGSAMNHFDSFSILSRSVKRRLLKKGSRPTKSASGAHCFTAMAASPR